ncbi:MAG: GNAT family N-acetyltransferase [Prevotella sp.]|jgi:hypothetical protein|nr:GNAT family N-acetyltransferase [Prevotella sp.]
MNKIEELVLEKEMGQESFAIQIANDTHLPYVPVILKTIEDAAKVRGTGIAKRSPEYLELKMKEGKAIIALKGEEFAGFCYIESWGNKQYVANSGLIVVDQFREHGLAKKIKQYAFSLARTMFPEAKVFGLTSGAAVMSINTSLGYVPVSFAQLTDDEAFWRGCQGCINYDVLTRTDRKYCICTAMLFDPAKQKDKKEIKALIKDIKRLLK